MQVNVPVVRHVRDPGEAVTVYPVMGLPPLDDGVDHVTVACALPLVAPGATGADGGPDGVAGFDVPAGPVPMALVALTSNV